MNHLGRSGAKTEDHVVHFVDKLSFYEWFYL